MEKNIDIDEETSPEVNRMSKLSFSIDYKQDVVGRQINIKEYVLKDEKFAKKIYFLVAGDDNQGSFEVSRRYKEFIYLRNTLIDSWPGFYVPKIPMKNYTNTSDERFIEKQKKTLELFLKKISNLEYIYISIEFQGFLRDTTDYKILSKKFLNGKFAEVIVNTFPRYSNMDLPENVEEKYTESEKLFRTTLDSMAEFRDRSAECVESFDTFESDLIFFLNDLQEIGAVFTSKSKNIGKRETFFNPYVILLEWVEAEILDVESIIEAIESRKKYNLLIEKLKSKLESSRKTLMKLQSGRKSLTQLFTKKSKEDMSAECFQEVERLENDVKVCEKCFKVMTIRLINKEIPMFKEAKLKTYKHIMKVFATASIQELTIIVQQTKGLEYFIEN